MSRATFAVENPGEVEVKLEMTMTVAQWAEVRKALTTAHFYGPTGWLREAIDQLTRSAEKEFRFTAEEEGAAHDR